MKNILADTGPLYAAFDSGDQYHTRALTEIRRIGQEKLEVLLPFPVALESYSLVLQRLGSYRARKFFKNLRGITKLINPTDDDYLMAMEKVNRYPDQAISLFDALTATLSERLDIPVWTYDFHFDVMGIQVWR